MTFIASDKRRLDLFRSGDGGVLAAVYDYYVDDVARALRGGFHVRSGADMAYVPGLTSTFDVECATHEVFLRAFAESARRAYDGIRSYRNYLVFIARNLRIDQFRRCHREVVLAEVEQLADLQAAPEPVDDDRELRGLVSRFVEGLDPLARAYYDERYGNGRSQVEASQAHGMSRRQGRGIESRLKKELLTYLRAHGYEGLS